jgi:hypothetical protein
MSDACGDVSGLCGGGTSTGSSMTDRDTEMSLCGGAITVIALLGITVYLKNSSKRALAGHHKTDASGHHSQAI